MILIFVLLAVAFGMLFGFLRGFKKSIVRLSSVVLAAVLAFVLALVVANSLISSGVFADFMENSIEGFNEIEKASPSLAELMETLPVIIATPIIFLVLYWILKAFLWIPCKILYKVLKFDKKKKAVEVKSEPATVVESEETSDDTEEAETETVDAEVPETKDIVVKDESKKKLRNKLLGIPMGAAQALVSVLVVLFVIGGYLTVVDRVMDSLMNVDDEEFVEELEVVEETLDNITSDPIMKMFVLKESNNFVFEGLTQLTVDGEKCSFTEEVVTMVDTVVDLTPLMESESSNVISDEQINLLNDFVSDFGDSVILKTVGAEVISNCGSKWSEGEDFMDVSFDNVNKNLKPIVDEIFNIMATEKSTTIEKDMRVFIELLNIFNKYDLLETSHYNVDNFINTLNSGFTNEIMDVLSKNKRFSGIIPEIENLSISILSSALKLPEVSVEEYDAITEEIADAMNYIRNNNDPDEVKQWMTNEIYDAVNENGIEVDEDVANIAAEAITKAFEDHEGEFTKEVIQEYFNNYSLNK